MGHTKNAPWVYLENGVVWFSPPIDWVNSTRLSCIDCKQNKLWKDEVE